MLFQEELLWYQKAGTNWLNFGDKNLWFFHALTIIRRKRNKVEFPKNDYEEWISNETEIHDMSS